MIPDGVEFTVTRNYGETATDKAQKLIGKLVFATASRRRCWSGWRSASAKR